VELRWDARRFDEREDSLSTCRRCNLTLILLPDDRRHGLCFDCFDPLDNYEGLAA
jgi:hypothetical protein